MTQMSVCNGCDGDIGPMETLADRRFAIVFHVDAECIGHVVRYYSNELDAYSDLTRVDFTLIPPGAWYGIEAAEWLARDVHNQRA